MPGLHSRDVDFVASNVVLGLVPEPGVSRQSNGRRPYAPKRAAAILKKRFRNIPVSESWRLGEANVGSPCGT